MVAKPFQSIVVYKLKYHSNYFDYYINLIVLFKSILLRVHALYL